MTLYVHSTWVGRQFDTANSNPEPVVLTDNTIVQALVVLGTTSILRKTSIIVENPYVIAATNQRANRQASFNRPRLNVQLT